VDGPKGCMNDVGATQEVNGPNSVNQCGQSNDYFVDLEVFKWLWQPKYLSCMYGTHNLEHIDFGSISRAAYGLQYHLLELCAPRTQTINA